MLVYTFVGIKIFRGQPLRIEEFMLKLISLQKSVSIGIAKFKNNKTIYPYRCKFNYFFFTSMGLKYCSLYPLICCNQVHYNRKILLWFVKNLAGYSTKLRYIQDYKLYMFILNEFWGICVRCIKSASILLILIMSNGMVFFVQCVLADILHPVVIFWSLHNSFQWSTWKRCNIIHFLNFLFSTIKQKTSPHLPQFTKK